jgi:hypothetical protein
VCVSTRVRERKVKQTIRKKINLQVIQTISSERKRGEWRRRKMSEIMIQCSHEKGGD